MSVRKPRLKWLFACLFAIILGLDLLGNLLVEPAKEPSGWQFNRGLNAAWLGIEWVSGSRDKRDIIALADELSRQQIQYAFVFVSYMNPEGEFNPTYSYAKEFIHALKATSPDLNVQAWIGLPLRNQSGNGYVDLGNVAIRSKIVSFCMDMVHNIGFDGVHLDPEPLFDGDTNVLALLDELRRQTRSTATISIAGRRIWPIPGVKLPVVANFAWRAAYYREIARRVDQVAVMTYDSGLPFPSLYRCWVNIQVVQLSQALDDVQVELFIGLPSSEERTLTHRPNAENIASGLQGVIEGLNDPDAQPSAVTGVAIYPYWEMDADKWAIYESLWLNR
jgi:hypothetical protein